MELRFEHGNFDDARIVRTRVFMEEQGFQDEFDDIDDDPRTIHVTLYDANALVGCARTFPDPDRPDQPGRWVFGRLAVLPEARRGGPPPPRLIPAREKGSPAEAGDPRNASVHCGYAAGCTLTRCPG